MPDGQQPLSELAIQLVLGLWSEGLSRLERHLDPSLSGSFKRNWAAICNALADDYPALDPFAPELSYRDGALLREVDDLDPDFIAALIAATYALAQRYRMSPGALRGVMQGDDPEFQQPQVLGRSGLAKLWAMQEQT